ncbi:MAG: DMT family transporter [Sediminimonas qiaohouensis]|uniref:DMT family transporter n=1 Tax=Sediminimonas qiaohouensis TaxID=552061 RepID=A0A7C9LJS8_9RHOB|nr:DMT family transporter [Sediminimonas qiaohouensis]MTJ03439.1 DMT family transporter [Sediminimonas qiaohouensis]
MTADRPLLGILLMLGFCVVAPMGDATAKLLGETVALGLLLIVRFGLQALLLIPLVVLGGRIWRMRGKALALAGVRTVLHVAGIGMMFTALRFLPLADAIAIAFVMPFIMLLLGKFALGEEVGTRRLLACCAGFIGTLLVIQPSFAEVGWPALLPLGVALDFALFMLVTRTIARESDPIALQAISGVMACAVLLPPLLLLHDSGLPGFDTARPSPREWALLILVGVLGTLGHLLMTWALRLAPSATLAPMQYLEIPFATLIGWIVFNDLPDGLALLGIVVTVAAGLYIIVRERTMYRAARVAPQRPGPAPPAAE